MRVSDRRNTQSTLPRLPADPHQGSDSSASAGRAADGSRGARQGATRLRSDALELAEQPVRAHTWHCSHRKDERPLTLTRTTVLRQRRQAWPSRS